MRLKGIKLSGPNVETIVIPRGSGQPIVLKARAVPDMDEFNKLCPVSAPPTKILKGGVRVPDSEDSSYKQSEVERSRKRMAYMVIWGLQATEGLEWDTVKLEDPSTWLGYVTELKAAGFNEFEINRIVEGVMAANCLNEEKLEAARQSFLTSAEGEVAGTS